MVHLRNIIFVFLVSFNFYLYADAADKTPKVLVSIAPHRAFVREIAGNTIDVQVIVPAGASSHSFEPTPRQMVDAGKADMWFRVGESFEARFADVIRSYHPEMKMVNMRDGVSMIKAEKCHGHQCSHDFEDVHIWLSPKEVKVQAETISRALSAMYPENAQLYAKNKSNFLKKLDALDADIRKILSDCNSRILLVSHPAYAYFARDYGFTQLSVEFEGKDPTPQQLTNLIKRAKEAKVGIIFTQPQHSNKGALLIARHLNAKVENIDPYAENYFDNMRSLAEKIPCRN
ncbi:MAG: zinc ABC transporter substrate-binding protein [Chlamydiota bacterium]|nr:zinc ABC transporter substrate-binding protein [Chlamydiota bacterium]